MPPRTKKSAATPAKKSAKTSKAPAKSEVKSNDVVLSENNENVHSNTSTDLSLELKSDVNGSFSLRSNFSPSFSFLFF